MAKGMTPSIEDSATPDPLSLYAGKTADEQLALLKDRLSDALRKIASEQPSWYFENDEKVDLKDMYSWRDIEVGRGTTKQTYSGDDILLMLLNGRVFDAEELIMRDDDGHRGQDEDWHKGELRSLLNGDFAQELDLVAESLGKDLDDLAEKLIDEDEDLDTYQVHEGSLNYTNLQYDRSASVYVELDLTTSTEPTQDLAELLWRLRISPDQWLSEVQQLMQEQSEDDTLSAKDWGLDDDDASWEDLYQQYETTLRQSMSMLVMRGRQFAEDPEEAIVDVKELMGKMQSDWSGSGTLTLLLTLDSSHIDAVSKPVSRHKESAQANDVQIEVSGAILTNDSTLYDDNLLYLRKPMPLTLGTLRVQKDIQEECGSIALKGAFGADCNLYELLLKADKDNRDIFRLARESKEGLPADHPLAPQINKAIENADAFELHKLSASYTGLAAVIQPLLEDRLQALTPQAMGADLLKVLGGWIGHDGSMRWHGSEDQQRAHWLVINGANPNAATPNGMTALLYAASLGDFELVKTLHDRGADVTARYRVLASSTEHEEGAWELAARRALGQLRSNRTADIGPELELLRWLPEHGADCPFDDRPLAGFEGQAQYTKGHIFCLLGQEDMLNEHLSRARARLPEKQYHRQLQSLLYVSLLQSNITGINLATAAGADIDGPSHEWDGETLEAVTRSTGKRYKGFNLEAFESAVALCRASRAMRVINSAESPSIKPLTP